MRAEEIKTGYFEMGGWLKRYELVVHNILLVDVEAIWKFHACGWLGYFLQLTEYSEEVALEFMTTFDEGEAIVWRLRVISTEERISEVTGLPAVGEHYPNEHDARSSRAHFTRPGDPQMDITKQGCKRLSLPAPYSILATHIIRYLTYEGKFSNLHAYNFKLLSCIRNNM